MLNLLILLLIYYRTVSSFRFCPQGIPSGRTSVAMLAEVRKEAFDLRKCKISSNADEEDEEENEEIAPTSIAEEWSTWFPQEWIGWYMFGVPSENPTEHWVNQPASSGPTDVENYYTDEKGLCSSKKLPGRHCQREKANSEVSIKKSHLRYEYIEVTSSNR